MKYSIELLKSDIRDELRKLYKLEREFMGVQESSVWTNYPLRSNYCTNKSLNFFKPSIRLILNLNRIDKKYPVNPALTPWNVYPACPVGRNYRTGVKCEAYFYRAKLIPLG
jgi:hypothetical protein